MANRTKQPPAKRKARAPQAKAKPAKKPAGRKKKVVAPEDAARLVIQTIDAQFDRYEGNLNDQTFYTNQIREFVNTLYSTCQAKLQQRADVAAPVAVPLPVEGDTHVTLPGGGEPTPCCTPAPVEIITATIIVTEPGQEPNATEPIGSGEVGGGGHAFRDDGGFDDIPASDPDKAGL